MRYRNASISDILGLLDSTDRKVVERAYGIAKKCTSGALLRHQINTAFTLAKLGLDASTVAAGLLHEIGGDINKATLGNDVKEIVKEVTKLELVKSRNIGRLENRNLAKVILAIAKDVRSIIVELASHLDKIRFVGKYHKGEQKILAELALEVYAPVCHKLGLYDIEWEMQDLAFKRLQPEEYYKIKMLINEKREARVRKLEKACELVEALMRSEGLDVFLQSRVKNFYSIYRKMKEQGKQFNQIYDLLGIRILCNSVEDCYKALNTLHRHFDPMGKFYDYIAKPKENMYRSIHTVVKISDVQVEVQIRTWDMHRDAEDGIAAHWRYKRFEQDKHFDKVLSWAKQLVELQRKEGSNFLSYMKIPLAQNNIFVLTPKNDIVVLPRNSTALDFAYAIHTDIGNKCKAVFVNGKQKRLDYVLESGDVVEVITDSKRRVKRSWLAFVKTNKAKAKIRKVLGLKGRPAKEIKVLRKDVPRKIVIAKCCTPLFGDDVIAYRTTKRKITIHRADCTMLSRLPDERKFRVNDDLWRRKSYVARIEVKAFERAGLFIDILKTIQRLGMRISGSEVRTDSGNIVRCIFDVNVKSLDHIESMRKALLNIQNVLSVERV
ncbi:MAG: bifunctional (p)ppGpp synthetase/guanosine-3',5'-bis(diphosphate) 3'-pyrophosphohydrolase [Candidatus Diapherotrites archaeon]|nr:bifunctional (p)ppGpp synthetase/guanosine-3',5'-bis(diphosphate) 3'-pyrophosphohydrolase [Candidatus Diapherotrites archaeon]